MALATPGMAHYEDIQFQIIGIFPVPLKSPILRISPQ